MIDYYRTKTIMIDYYRTIAKEFFELQNIKVGSRVKVLHSVPHEHLGWPNTWTPEMNKMVGKECIVTGLENDQVYLKTGQGLGYPFFVIQKVVPPPIKLNTTYDAEFNLNGSIKVGCQYVEFSDLEKVYNAAKSI